MVKILSEFQEINQGKHTSTIQSSVLVSRTMCDHDSVWQMEEHIFKTHLDHIGFVSLQDLNGLSCIWVNDEDTRVTALSDQTLPSPEQRERQNG